MACNPSLKELVNIFKGTLDEGVVSGVYHDMHGNGDEAIKILSQLRKSMEIPKTQQNHNQTPVETNNRGPQQSSALPRGWGRGGKAPANFRITNSVTEKRINADKIRIPGYHDRKALYLMRGLSGSGKSTYAKKIVREIGRGEIFSTDDFFMLNEANEYRFVHADLEIAHKWNQQRVEGALSEGLSPVIVDNTNTQFWEMKPYVIAGIEQGYNCYFIEPPTEWKFKVNQLYRKSKHGLHKAQLVAALKRYEKNPTVEKVIGPAYLSKMKHSHCAGDNSSASGYVPFTSVKTEKSEKSNAPLVPYIFSDSSDEQSEREEGVEGRKTPQDQEASVKYREYNNNSTCPKVLNKSSGTRAAWDKGVGNLGKPETKSGNPSDQPNLKIPDHDGNAWGEKSDFENTGSDENADWDQDMSEWLADMEAREIEDKLLENLEKQESTELDEDMSEVIDIQKLREESVKKLSTWESGDSEIANRRRAPLKGNETARQRIPGGSETVQRGIRQGSPDATTGLVTEGGHSRVIKEGSDDDDIPGLESEDESEDGDDELENLGRKSCEPIFITYVSKVFTLVEICRRKLKTMLKVSYHNSSEYWSAHEEARELAKLTCIKNLPPPTPQPQITSPTRGHVMSRDLLEPYVIVSEDNIIVSPSKPAVPSKESAKKSSGKVIQETVKVDDPVPRELEINPIEERMLNQKQMQTIKLIEGVIGPMEREKLISVCEECDWDEDEIVECLLLKESLKEITEETIKEESANLSKLLQSEPPSIRTLLNVEESTVQSGSDVEKGEESEISSNSTASKAGYDSKDDTEVTTLSLPPKVVNTLTDMFGHIVGLPADKNIKIPVNQELASQLHSALYFAHIDKKITHKGKEKMKPIKLQQRNPPPVFPAASSVPFNEIVKYQKKLPERKGKMKKLVAEYPGMDERFLEDVLSSCGNDLQRALNALSTDCVSLKYLDDEEKLYSSRTEYTPERSKQQNVEYTQITQPPHLNTYTGTNLIVPPGTLIEQAEAYRELSGHNLSQAKLWHSKKKGLVAGHYAKQGARYRDLAEETEMKIFDGTIVRDKLRELKLNPVLDLHGLTLTQSKYLLTEAFDHFNHMIGQDPEFPRTLTVITGKGLHSAGGVPRLKLGVKALLNTLAIPYNEEVDGYKVKFRS